MFGIKIISTKQFNALKAAARSDADQLVAAIKNVKIEGKEGTLADAIADSIEAIDSSNLSGAEKFKVVVGEAGPLILRYAKNGGIQAVLADVEDIARQVVQSVYNEVKSTGFAALINKLLKLLGL